MFKTIFKTTDKTQSKEVFDFLQEFLYSGGDVEDFKMPYGVNNPKKNVVLSIKAKHGDILFVIQSLEGYHKLAVELLTQEGFGTYIPEVKPVVTMTKEDVLNYPEGKIREAAQQEFDQQKRALSDYKSYVETHNIFNKFLKGVYNERRITELLSECYGEYNVFFGEVEIY